MDEGKLCLTFQPQVDLASGRLVGAEALLRWRREGELVLPGQFIHVVEGTDLAEPISRWVLATACAQARAWLDRRHPLRVTVNIFSGHVTGGRLVGDVHQALVTTSLPPHMLELELVESSLLAQPERSAQTLRALKRLGVRLALDDFGTGYSSLGYLKHYPFDLLKIDRLFVANVSRDPHDAAIVRSTVELAHNLGMEVLAEGVETPGQWRFLARYGCDQAQGFLLSRPIPPETVETLLMERRDLRPPEARSEQAPGILLVEDVADEAEVLKALFEDGGARTYWARDATEALALVESRAIDIIITDYHLGETTGTQVLCTLHALYPEIPAIMVSSTNEQEVVIDALNRGGIRAFLPKPLDPDRLRATLEAILGRGGTHRQG